MNIESQKNKEKSLLLYQSPHNFRSNKKKKKKEEEEENQVKLVIY